MSQTTCDYATYYIIICLNTTMSVSKLEKDPHYQEYKRMIEFDNVGYFTSFHQTQDLLLDEPFELQKAFTDNMIG